MLGPIENVRAHMKNPYKDPGFLNQVPALTKECAPRTFCEEAEVLQKSHVREPQLSNKPPPRFRLVVTLNLAPCRVCDFQDLFSSMHARSERQVGPPHLRKLQDRCSAYCICRLLCDTSSGSCLGNAFKRSSHRSLLRSATG